MFYDCPQYMVLHYEYIFNPPHIFWSQISAKYFVSEELLHTTFWSENFFRRSEQKCCGYWIRLTRNVRVCNARSGKVGSSHCYLERRQLHEMATFDEIVYEYDRKHSQLVYVSLSSNFNTLFKIIRVCRSRFLVI